MADSTRIPKAVLSEHFQELMGGRVLKTGVFLTYSLDPGFFEQEILPVFLDVPLSHQREPRLLQLEDAIRTQVDQLALYYDPRAMDGEVQPARLDIRRIPVSWRAGAFHPKNVLLLVEDAEPAEDGSKARRLLVGTLSANLTRSGWWENLETCHVEVLEQGQKSSLVGDLGRLCSRLRRAAPHEAEHAALREIERFLRGVPERLQGTTDGVLHPRLYVGAADGRGAGTSVPEFLDTVRGRELRGCNLEVISPFFDDTAEAGPLKALIDRFEPAEVRVFLPRAHDGTAQCGKAFFDVVRKLPNTSWAKLPAGLLESGAEAGLPRRVHAKVYRFFSQRRPGYEALLVGSVNLTNSAHSKGGNFETAVLVEPQGGGTPDWWLSTDRTKPLEFAADGAAEEVAGQGPGASLSLRYSWANGTAQAFWDATELSPLLKLESQTPLFELSPLPPQQWVDLGEDESAGLGAVLNRTSLVTVLVEGEDPATILVQEEGMAQKPSILLEMSVADILRCWSALTPEQKAVLIEERYLELVRAASALIPSAPLGRLPRPSFFDAFAGVFHAFGNLERKVFKALDAKRDSEAVHLLFGKKYDSLPHLLERLSKSDQADKTGSQPLKPVNRYVMLLCARQLVGRVRREAPAEFRAAHAEEIKALGEQLAVLESVIEELNLGSREERSRFLRWFETWFLQRAQPLEVGE